MKFIDTNGNKHDNVLKMYMANIKSLFNTVKGKITNKKVNKTSKHKGVDDTNAD